MDTCIDVDLIAPRNIPLSIHRTACATGWISPFFWPDERSLILESIRSSSDTALWNLVEDAHLLVQLASALDATTRKRMSHSANGMQYLHNISREKTPSLPKGSKSVPYYRYECCRLTVFLMTRVFAGGVDWSDAASGTSYPKDIMTSLSHSELALLWETQIGLLMWVAFLAHAALQRTEHRLFTSGIVNRLMCEMAWGDQDFRVGTETMKNMAEFKQSCISD